jgi:hypothetical protein
MGTTPRQSHESERGNVQNDQAGPADGQSLECVRAEALFVSDAQRSEHLSADEIRATVRQTVSRYSTDDLAARVAQEFGEHPDTAVGRMSWALCEVRTSYSTAYPAAA